jgi:hypothetical protein
LLAPVTPFSAVSPAGFITTGSQPLAERCPRRTGRACTHDAPQAVASATLLKPVARLGREPLAPFASFEKLSWFRPPGILPPAVETLPASAGIAVDVAVPARIDVAAPALSDEALPARRVPAQ